MDFKPHTLHFDAKKNRLYSKNKQGRKYVYSHAEARDLVTGGSIFNLKHHYQRFKGVLRTLKATFLGHSGKKTKTVEKFDTNRKVAAHLADAAYSGKAPKGFEVFKRGPKGRYTIFKQKTKSGPDRFTISFRGTQMNKSDLWNDVKIAMGKLPYRTKELLPEVEKFVQAHPQSVINLAGHSLGAAIAVETRERLKKKGYSQLKNAYAFSLPGSPNVVGKSKEKLQKALSDGKNIVTYKSGDPVSAGLEGYKIKNKEVLAGTSRHIVKLQHHKMKNFITKIPKSQE